MSVDAGSFTQNWSNFVAQLGDDHAINAHKKETFEFEKDAFSLARTKALFQSKPEMVADKKPS